MESVQIKMARLAALYSSMRQPQMNPFQYGGFALEFVTAEDENFAQAVLLSLPPVMHSCINLNRGRGFARLMAAVFLVRSDLKLAAELLLHRARGIEDWNRLLAVEYQCNCWTREAFYHMTGVPLHESSQLLRSNVVTKCFHRRYRGPAPPSRGQGPPLLPPAHAPMPQ